MMSFNLGETEVKRPWDPKVPNSKMLGNLQCMKLTVFAVAYRIYKDDMEIYPMV
jgi:hypothetical protein